MAAVVYLADPNFDDAPSPVFPSVLLDESPEYWFLYRYFESANLNRGVELIDLYGGGAIEGYQLHRLQTELEQAELDVSMKPDTWPVLVGWTSKLPSPEGEDWRLTSRQDVLALINSLLKLVRHSSVSGLKLICSGD